ncbi:putative Ser/Thr protein kinase [Acetoanaerobium pronyense]|uniref:Ser/Thr protein kinase n=1 Tax=Acetoanaerobium pronyense TaxID=1482736 RepID=A0ABS4KHH0_9FIRM|nr:phosphotransferase [Acetoanaerobium pronyense]MBP2027215.1 putative Ser/Thr protein kinase [Acetoanaerobium pronyense]
MHESLQIKIKEYIKDKEVYNHIHLDKEFCISFLAQGEYNINFKLEDEKRKYVFRVNTGSQIESDNQIKYEYEALKALEISGVTPNVRYLDDSLSYIKNGILIMDFLEGRPLLYNTDMKKAANIFSEIHSLDLKNMETSNFIVEENIMQDRINEGTRLLKPFFESKDTDKDLKDFFYKFLNWCEKNKDSQKYFSENIWHVINNTEVNSHNFIIGEKSYLIDWEKPVISDPSQDLTQFLAPTTTLWKGNYILSEEERSLFFNTYKENIGKSDTYIEERVKLYNPYLYLRALSWCAFAYTQYQDEDKTIKNMDTYGKIKEYLDIDFMKKLLRDYF